MKIDYVVLGASGYIGQAFTEELEKRGSDFVGLSRQRVDYTRFRPLLDFLNAAKPQFLINCAGYTGKPNVDACEKARNETIMGNIALVETIANACDVAGIPFGHVSSGCIYSGAKLRVDGNLQVVKNLMAPTWLPIWQGDREGIVGFSEDDEPNFSFDNPPCSFYSGTKAAAERLLEDHDDHYVWRLRIPFDERDNPRNYISKLLNYPKLYDNANSFSHRGDFARACVELWEQRTPFGTYNVTNPGWMTTRDVVGLMQGQLCPAKAFDFFADDQDFYKTAASTPRSNAVLDTQKLTSSAGISIRPVDEAVASALAEWSVARAVKSI